MCGQLCDKTQSLINHFLPLPTRKLALDYLFSLLCWWSESANNQYQIKGTGNTQDGKMLHRMEYLNKSFCTSYTSISFWQVESWNFKFYTQTGSKFGNFIWFNLIYFVLPYVVNIQCLVYVSHNCLPCTWIILTNYFNNQLKVSPFYRWQNWDIENKVAVNKW